MILDIADRQSSAVALAGIHALETDAGEVVETVVVLLAFPMTSTEVVVRIADEIGRTGAGTGTVPLAALGVRTAWVRRAWIRGRCSGDRFLTGASSGRIADVTLAAGADRCVIENRATSEIAAGSDAGILAAFVYTSGVGRTLGVVRALRSAVRWSPDEVWRAGAGGSGADYLALRIRSTWVGCAFVFAIGLRSLSCIRHPRAEDERIAAVAGGAGANGTVIDDEALGVQTTSRWTRIHALVVDAGFAARAFGADRALGSATRRRSDEAGFARAYRMAVEDSAVAVGTAGRRFAGLERRYSGGDDDRSADGLRISFVARQAGA